MYCIREPCHIMAVDIPSYVHLSELEGHWNVECNTAATNTHHKKRNHFSQILTKQHWQQECLKIIILLNTDD